MYFRLLTHWGRVTHICVSKLTIIGSDNGLSRGRRQAIIWTNARILLIRSNFNEMLIEFLTFPFMKMRWKVSSAKWRPFYLGLNVLISYILIYISSDEIHVEIDLQSRRRWQPRNITGVGDVHSNYFGTFHTEVRHKFYSLLSLIDER